MNKAKHEMNILEARLEEVKENNVKMERLLHATQAQNTMLIETVKKLSEDLRLFLKNKKSIK